MKTESNSTRTWNKLRFVYITKIPYFLSVTISCSCTWKSYSWSGFNPISPDVEFRLRGNFGSVSIDSSMLLYRNLLRHLTSMQPNPCHWQKINLSGEAAKNGWCLDTNIPQSSNFRPICFSFIEWNNCWISIFSWSLPHLLVRAKVVIFRDFYARKFFFTAYVHHQRNCSSPNSIPLAIMIAMVSIGLSSWPCLIYCQWCDHRAARTK